MDDCDNNVRFTLSDDAGDLHSGSYLNSWLS